MSALIDFLLRNAENKRVMATLRCALAESTEARAWPMLARFDGIGASQRACAVRTVAGLFAMHPQNCDKGNMGTVCRQLCDPDEKPWDSQQSEEPGPMARRLLYLLNADKSEICDRVCRLARFASSKNVPINYAELEQALTEWPRARELWAAEFWAPAAEKSGEEGES